MNGRLGGKSFYADFCAIALLLVAITSLSGAAQTAEAVGGAEKATPEIEAATIKPVKEPSPNRMHDNVEGRRLSTRYTSVRDLMMMAYEVDPRQIVDGPAWLASDEYDIDLVTGDGVPLDGDREEAIFRELLADRFQLKFHREQRTMNVYVLEVAKGGPRTEGGGCRRGGELRMPGSRPVFLQEEDACELCAIYAVCGSGPAGGG